MLSDRSAWRDWRTAQNRPIRLGFEFEGYRALGYMAWCLEFIVDNDYDYYVMVRLRDFVHLHRDCEWLFQMEIEIRWLGAQAVL